MAPHMWHVSSRSGVATLRTAIYLLLTYSLTDRQTDPRPMPCAFCYGRRQRNKCIGNIEHVAYCQHNALIPAEIL